MKLEIYEKNGTTLENIQKYENEFNISLPDEYKKFLVEQNGGEANMRQYIKPIFIEGFSGDKLSICEFSSIENIFKYLKESIEVYKENPESLHLNMELFKLNHLLIAQTYGDWQLSICFKGENRGKVYYSDFLSDIDEEIMLVSNNFYEFINGFEYIKEEDEECYWN